MRAIRNLRLCARRVAEARSRPATRYLFGFLVVGGVASAIAVGGAQPDAAVAAPPPQATLFVSTTGSDAGRCGPAAPCASFGRAYAVGRRGQVVEVAAGKYGRQVIEPDPSKLDGGGSVLFRPAPGGAVDISELVVSAGATHVAFQDMTVRSGWEVGPSDGGEPARDIVFRRVRSSRFYIMNAVGVQVLGGTYGPSLNDHPQIKVWNPGNTYAPTDILVQGVTFRDFVRANPDVHTECLQIYAGIRVTIRSNRFRNCDGTGSLTVASEFGATVSDVLIENNMFEAGDGSDEAYYDIQLKLCSARILIRYNSFTKGIALNDCPDGPSGPITFVGNYSPASSAMCGRLGVIYAYNVWVGRMAQRCAATDRVARTLQYVDPLGHDLHLAPRSVAIGAGSPVNYPRRDIDGNRRPLDKSPDAGADEVLVPCKTARAKSGECKKKR